MYAYLTAYCVYRRGKTMKIIVELAFLSYLFAVNVLLIAGCPHDAEDAKSAYKSGEMMDMIPPITLQTIQRKLAESGVFNGEYASLTERENKELSKLFEAVEIMTTSRNRQPARAQNVFASLRVVERAVKKLLKEGEISEGLAAKFNWDKLKVKPRVARQQIKPRYYLDKNTNMRVFDTS